MNDDPHARSPHSSDSGERAEVPRSTLRRDLLTVVLVIALALIAWQLAFVFLLAFGGVLLAVLFRRLALLLSERTPLPEGAALAFVVLGLVATLVGLVMVAEPLLGGQLATLSASLPDTLRSIEAALTRTDWGQFVLDRVTDANEERPRWNFLGTIGGTLSTSASLIANLVIVFTIGVFLALDPKLYRGGLLHLVPLERRERATEVLDALGSGLWRWLVGQSMSMLAVALLTGIGLWLIGVPLSALLGLIAGLFNFVPYLGPFFSAVPAVLVAFAQSPETAVYAALLFLLVQQIEGHVLTPVIQRRVSALPPVMIVLAVAGFGVLFGLAGVFLAAPLLLVAIILVRMLYVEDVLGDWSIIQSEG